MFLHPPKTGGNWVKAAIKYCEIPIREEGDRHAIIERADKFVFTFVRHPASWYVSRFRCPWHRGRIREGRAKDVDCLTPEEAADFHVWLNRVLVEHPGYVSHIYNRYTEKADFVGKQENLKEDLIQALKLAGEDVKPMRIRKAHPVHVSKINVPLYNEALLNKVLKGEAEAIEKFGYGDYSRWLFLPVKIL